MGNLHSGDFARLIDFCGVFAAKFFNITSVEHRHRAFADSRGGIPALQHSMKGAAR